MGQLKDKFPSLDMQVWPMPAAKTSQHAGINTLGKISQHFKWAFSQAFEKHGHTHAVVLEEDLVPAPDFLTFFEESAPLLDKDPSLWCVSSFNDNGMRGIATDATQLHRTGYFPGLGWMIKASLWKEELAAVWPDFPSTGWDHWIRSEARVHKHRECVFPEVPRVQHIGIEGTNVHESAGNSMLNFYAFQPIAVPTFASSVSISNR